MCDTGKGKRLYASKGDDGIAVADSGHVIVFSVEDVCHRVGVWSAFSLGMGRASCAVKNHSAHYTLMHTAYSQNLQTHINIHNDIHVIHYKMRLLVSL